MSVLPLPSPRIDYTSRDAIARADRGERVPLTASLAEWLEARHGARPKDPLIRLLISAGKN